MIGAGVLALPAVSAPVGFVPSSLALIAVWTYMVATGLLISELTVNTACALGRPNGISILSLASLTLGPFGAFVATVSYTLLHYAILTAYTSQGASDAFTLVRYVCDALHLALPPVCASPFVHGAAFSTLIGAPMFALPAHSVQRINNVLVAAVIAAFGAVLSAAISDVDLSRLTQLHWHMLARGPLVAVLFVSCVYHNVVSNVTMRLEGDRTKIRRTIVVGSAVPLLMFLAYDAAMLASTTGAQQLNQVAVALFSTLAIATSFIGFVEGLTELWADVRQTLFRHTKHTSANAADFVATIAPPTLMAGLWPDAFLRALDAAGTYGIAVLFGALPAAMAWRNRRRDETKELGRSLAGGDLVLGALALPPLVLIAHRVQTLWSAWLAAHAT